MKRIPMLAVIAVKTVSFDTFSASVKFLKKA